MRYLLAILLPIQFADPQARTATTLDEIDLRFLDLEVLLREAWARQAEMFAFAQVQSYAPSFMGGACSEEEAKFDGAEVVGWLFTQEDSPELVPDAYLTLDKRWFEAPCRGDLIHPESWRTTWQTIRQQGAPGPIVLVLCHV